MDLQLMVIDLVCFYFTKLGNCLVEKWATKRAQSKSILMIDNKFAVVVHNINIFCMMLQINCKSKFFHHFYCCPLNSSESV